MGAAERIAEECAEPKKRVRAPRQEIDADATRNATLRAIRSRYRREIERIEKEIAAAAGNMLFQVTVSDIIASKDGGEISEGVGHIAMYFHIKKYKARGSTSRFGNELTLYWSGL